MKYTKSRIVRRCGQLGISFELVQSSSYWKKEGVSPPESQVQYKDGKDETVGWGASKEQIRAPHASSHSLLQMSELLDLEIERLFDDKVLEVYENAKKELGYNATRFLQKIRKDGGLLAAKTWLHTKSSGSPTKGFLKLVDFGKLDISLEALVIKKPWCGLFNDDELKVARDRLIRYGYFQNRENNYKDNDETIPEVLDSENLYEGAVQSVTVNRYERNRKAREECIKYYGSSCHICKFDFKLVYGAKFKDFIHVHHLAEISAVTEEYIIDPVSDLRPLCPNCHAIVHRRKPCYTIEDVRSFIRKH